MHCFCLHCKKTHHLCLQPLTHTKDYTNTFSRREKAGANLAVYKRSSRTCQCKEKKISSGIPDCFPHPKKKKKKKKGARAGGVYIFSYFHFPFTSRLSAAAVNAHVRVSCPSIAGSGARSVTVVQRKVGGSCARVFILGRCCVDSLLRAVSLRLTQRRRKKKKRKKKENKQFWAVLGLPLRMQHHFFPVIFHFLEVLRAAPTIFFYRNRTNPPNTAPLSSTRRSLLFPSQPCASVPPVPPH
jgi:hypothetical protein